MVLWRHCHDAQCEPHDPVALGNGGKVAGSIVMVGDTARNFADGILIGVSFLIVIQLGVVTSIAVTAHEIPQELGDFAVLLHSGFARVQALVF